MKIIAESAFNHNGDIEYLKELAVLSKKSGADFFTVQVMNPNSFCVQEYSKAQIYHDNSFTSEQWTDFFDFCRIQKIELIPCILDESSFDLCYSYGFRFLKLHATDITNVPYLKLIKSKGDCSIILETQCSTYQDIECAIGIIGDYVKVLFHGFSNYPTEIEDINLNAIKSLSKEFPGFKYGFADHSPTVNELPLMALSMGIDYLEKHITITRHNRNMDYQVSLYPEEFAMMVQSIHLYEKALGKEVKHPTKNELPYRNVMFKKKIDDNLFKRADHGQDYLTALFESFSNDRIGIALVARLKSQRLKKKVLKPFIEKTIIEDLFNSMKRCALVSNISLCTSYLEEDKELCSLMGPENSFCGHPISVLDRLLSYAKTESLGGVFRITGDNPFTEPELVDQMVKLFVTHSLDYVRVNNVPFGISAELFSTSYLWKLYLNMDNPLNSEYLSWFVLNDNQARKGCINFIPKDPRTSLVNLSVDYPEDYERVISLSKRCGYHKIADMNFKQTISCLDLNDITDENKQIKLPESKTISFKHYLDLMNNIKYIIKQDYNE